MPVTLALCRRALVNSVSISPIHAKEHSPPRRGGVDATSIKCCEASLFMERTGWSDRRKGFPGLTTFTASRYRARASRPSAPSAQPPLLCEEGNIPRNENSDFQTESLPTDGPDRGLNGRRAVFKEMLPSGLVLRENSP